MIKHLLGLALGAAMALQGFSAQAADDTIKVGIMHSLSGTMAISESSLKDELPVFEELNGLLFYPVQ